MTALRTALEKAGINKDEMIFFSACMLVLRAVGYQRALVVLDRARDELSRRGHQNSADGDRTAAPPRQTNEGEMGQAQTASDGQQGPALSPSPDRGQEGHVSIANTAGSTTPPVREPSPSQLAASLAAAKAAAASVFDRELTRTGQRWGNVRYCELGNMTRDGEFAEAIRRHIGSLRGLKALKPIRELMTPREFAILINRAKAKQNAA